MNPVCPTTIGNGAPGDKVMWLSLGEGPIEVVPNPDRQDELTVRAPFKRDLVRLFPGAPVQDIARPEHNRRRYSVRLRRAYVAEVISKAVRDID